MSETTPAPDLSFEMPPELATQGFAVRPRTPQDTDFLRELYISFRWAELEAAGWPEATRRYAQYFSATWAHDTAQHAVRAERLLARGEYNDLSVREKLEVLHFLCLTLLETASHVDEMQRRV